jgi:cytochrome c biogenesis protein CcdA/glutaredoxin
MKKIFSVLLLLVFLSSFVLSQEDTNDVEIYFFHSTGCPHCAKMDIFLSELEQEYPELNVTKYELNDNIELLLFLSDRYNLKLTDRIPIPIVFINHKVLVGYNKDIANSIKTYVEGCIKTGCISPIKKEKGDTIQTTGESTIAEKGNIWGELTIPAVISAAAVDAINPCAFAVLIILMTTILASGVKKRALFAGFAFTASIFISYFLMGLGLYSAVSVTGISHVFYIAVAILAIIIGLFNLKDYLWYGKWFIMEVPRSWRPRMKILIKRVTSVPGAFLIGFIISLFLLPCTSGPYIVILGLLAKATTRNFAVMLLLLYNFIFVLPMLLITLGIYFGFTTTEKAEEWRTRKLKVLHLIAGIIMLLLGIGMFIAMWLGFI